MRDNKGITGVDVAIAIVIIIIFVSFIVAMFGNIAITTQTIEKKATATNIAIQAIESMKIMSFADLNSTKDNPMTVEKINLLTGNQIEVPNGYKLDISIENYQNADIIKIITAQVSYQENKKEENIKIETLIKDSSLIPGETEDGNYLVNGSIYVNTLIEALAVENVSTIKVLKNVAETDAITISNNITFDTNGKTVTCSNTITVNETATLSIKGTGTIQGTESGNDALIIDKGNLNIDDATITSKANTTIYLYGKITVNSGNISNSESSGNVENPCIRSVVSDKEKLPVEMIINGGNMEIIAIDTGEYIINAGTIDTIKIIDNIVSEPSLTIGDINKDINNNQPQINEIWISPTRETLNNITINFYNGIIKEINFTVTRELLDLSEIYGASVNIRSGYTVQTTTDGTILVSN